LSRTKNEIDKEQMYKKLMPSSVRSALAQEPKIEPVSAAEPVNEAAKKPAAMTATPQKEMKPHHITLPSFDNRQTTVVNVMELYVLSKLNDVLERFSCCRCDRCRKDIVALALNKLPPKYMVLAEGEPEPDITPQINAQVIAAMIQAVIKVRANPRH
jgi:competence protein ComFB